MLILRVVCPKPGRWRRVSLIVVSVNKNTRGGKWWRTNPSKRRSSTFRPSSRRTPGSRAWSSTRRCTGALWTTPTPSGRRRQRRRLHWFKKWDYVQNHDFGNAKVRWFEGGKLNVSYNCLDRHIEAGKGDKVAYYFEGDSPESTRTITYKQLWEEVTKFANVLKKKGVKKGDRVVIYLPMIPALPVAMLACARIGAIHCVVFGGFSADALRDRILNADATLMITADTGLRGGKPTPLKTAADAAMAECPDVKTCIVVKHTGTEIPWTEGRDIWYDDEMAAPDITTDCPCEEMDAEDPLFILYTSGSTGKPKGVMHTTGGYLLYAAMTHELIFDYHPEQVYWCTADIGWVTGHTYIVYGPLANGATSILFEGVPSYPTPDRFWSVVEKYKVNIFYTAPTALRSIAREGDDWVKKHDLSSLRVLGTVGEPINPEVWLWYHDLIGGGTLPDRGHLVADRDRRHPHHPAARRHEDQAGFGHPALLRRRAVHRRRRRARDHRPGRGQPVHETPLAGHDARRLRRSRALQGDLLRPVPRLLLHRRRLPA